MEITPIVTTILFMIGIGAVAAIAAIVSSRFFTVQTDPRIEAVTQALPGANCGACGYSGCLAAAEAVVKGAAGPGVCLIGKEAVKLAVEQIMQVAADTVKKKRAYLCCSKNSSEAGTAFTYNGPSDCRAASMLYGGGKTCAGGCSGHGTCTTVCPVDAIQMRNGLPLIDPVRCTGCGLCVKICPKKIISLVDDTPAALEKKRCAEYCSNKHLLFEVDQRKCIQCGICFKNCPSDAITWEKGTAAAIIKEKCTACYTCMRLCPKKVIV
jgi:Na+-translocating ferredoxin:NAD+ oxidoreductase subunit B